MSEHTNVDTVETAPATPAQPAPAVPDTYTPPKAKPGDITKVRHTTCKKLTDLGVPLAKEHRRLPEFFATLPCHHCKANCPVSEFTWADETQFAQKTA